MDVGNSTVQRLRTAGLRVAAEEWAKVEARDIGVALVRDEILATLRRFQISVVLALAEQRNLCRLYRS